MDAKKEETAEPPDLTCVPLILVESGWKWP